MPNEPPGPPPDLDRQESRFQKIVKKPSLVKYIIQSSFGMVVLLLCATQLLLNPDASNEIWVGMICAIVGIFLPHPTPEDTRQEPPDDTTATTTTTIHERITSTPVIRPARLPDLPEFKSRG